MFDIGWSELLVILVVAIVVVGPKDLPKLMGTFGHYAGKLRRAAADFQRQFNEAMRDTEIAEVTKALESMRTEAASLDLKETLDRPMMLPNPVAAPAVQMAEAKAEVKSEIEPETKAEAKPKPVRKSASKPKSSGKSSSRTSGGKTSGGKTPGGKPPTEPGP
jgi:sec-independent protein translocase protein TatB